MEVLFRLEARGPGFVPRGGGPVAQGTLPELRGQGMSEYYLRIRETPNEVFTYRAEIYQTGQGVLARESFDTLWGCKHWGRKWLKRFKRGLLDKEYEL
jgi:hypothetical protein